MVTCYTCHRGVQHPEVTPSLAEQYGAPPPDDPDRVEVIPNTPDDPAAAEQILDKFIQAVGGAQQLAKLTSFTAKGTYAGFDTDFQKVPVGNFRQRLRISGPRRIICTAETIRPRYDGREGWIASADRPVPMILLTGGDLDGAKAGRGYRFSRDAQAKLEQMARRLPACHDRTITPLQVVEGTAAGGTRVKLFFDKQTGLLVRQTRLIETEVGLIPLHIDYSDYRAVSGVKMPFQVADDLGGRAIDHGTDQRAGERGGRGGKIREAGRRQCRKDPRRSSCLAGSGGLKFAANRD